MSEKYVDNLTGNLSDGQRKEWKRSELKCPGRRAGWKISKTRNISQNIGRNKEGEHVCPGYENKFLAKHPLQKMRYIPPPGLA